MLGISLLVVREADGVAIIPAIVPLTLAILWARLLPWRFAVVDGGLALWFPLGQRRFLAKDRVVVHVGPGTAVAHPLENKHIGYALTNGLVEHRLPTLRAILAEHGFLVT
jgi:hypothetical protein